jgi:hypothetical protein
VRVPLVGSAVRASASIGAAVARPVGRRAGRAGLAALDAVLDSRFAADAVDRVGASPLAERALGVALEGPLVEAIARDLVRYRVADRLLSEGLVEQTTARLLEGGELERAVESALDSRLLDLTIERLLDQRALWLLVDEIARSPAVTEAIAQQSVGFADQVAGGVRARSRNADAWLERRARRALRRPPEP